MFRLQDKILASFKILTREISFYLERCKLDSIRIDHKVGASGSRERVTEIDRAIERICVDFLRTHFPSIPVFAEEGYRRDHSVLDNQWVFIIDPIDGTSEFLRGSDEWAVSLAAVKDARPEVGLLFMPARKITLWAVRGGATGSDRSSILPEVKAGGEKLRLAVSPRQIKISELSSLLKQSGLQLVPVPTLTQKVVRIILGEVDAAVYFPQQGKSANVWDYAASALLVESIGGEITSLTGKPLPFRGDDVIHRDGWLATSGQCNHGELLKKLTKT